MLTAEVGNIQQFLSSLLRRRTYLPGVTTAVASIIDEKLLIKLMGGSHLEALNFYLTCRNQIALMIHLMIYVSIGILMIFQFQLRLDDEHITQ